MEIKKQIQLFANTKKGGVKMNKQTLIEIVKIIANAIIAIIAALTVTACTASLSISKNNNASSQSTQQEVSSKIDSATLKIK